MVGLRSPTGLEFGIGPNITPAGVALARGRRRDVPLRIAQRAGDLRRRAVEGRDARQHAHRLQLSRPPVGRSVDHASAADDCTAARCDERRRRCGPASPRPGERSSRSAGCWPVTSRDRVVVDMDDGPARTGTLLCMGPDEIMLTGSGTLPLSTIRQISKPRDSYLDGMLKGAAVGLVILVFCAPDCPGGVRDARDARLRRDRRHDRRLAGQQQDDLSARADAAAIAWRVRF